MKEMIRLSGGQVYVDGKLQEKDLIITGGKVMEIISCDASVSLNTNVIDCTGKLILPGTIDTHVHIREPGSEKRETFYTGTMAAAAGGVTTVFEHPISNPPPFNPEILQNRVRLARKQILVDCCFYGALGAESIQNVGLMKEQGIIAFKTFLQEPMPGREKEFEGLSICDDYTLLKAMEEGARHDMLLCYHAENDDIIQGETKRLIREGRKDAQAHYESHPVISETESVHKLLLLAQETGAHIEICHVSSAEALDLLREAKEKGIRVVVETCPHYLFVTQEEAIEKGPMGKCNPAIRPAKDLERIWAAVNDGTVDIIGSDHAPFTMDEKEKGYADIFKAPAGFPGIETRTPLMLDALSKKKLTLEKFVALMSENPARIFGIGHRKGFLKPGYDADLIIVDMEKQYVIDKNTMYTKGRDVAELYHGREVTGKIDQVMVRGKTVMQGGQVNDSLAGYGEIVTPIFFQEMGRGKNEKD
jgi:allantoinase